MAKDFFPGTDDQRKVWFENYRNQIVTDGPAVGVEGPTATEQQAACGNAITAYTDVDTKYQAWLGAVAAKKTAVDNAMKNVLRPAINRIKTNAGYTAAIGNHLRIIGSGSDESPADYVAKITAEVTGGFVRIKFVKGIAEGVNIYHRLKGSGTWQFLARDTKSPYDDHIEIPAGGAPQHWEYQAFGVLDDAQIGSPSEIAEATIG